MNYNEAKQYLVEAQFDKCEDFFKENIYPHENLFMNIHVNIIHNNQNVETIPKSIN